LLDIHGIKSKHVPNRFAIVPCALFSQRMGLTGSLLERVKVSLRSSDDIPAKFRCVSVDVTNDRVALFRWWSTCSEDIHRGFGAELYLN
jgi:hypothetical protein